MRFVYNDPYALRNAVELAGQQPIGTRIVMAGPEVVDAVKGQGYREVESKSNRRKGRPK